MDDINKDTQKATAKIVRQWLSSDAIRLYLIKVELWLKLGDDGLRRAAYRGG
ncbi:hypothetical protein [Mesorhizobium huakuii]|uniref:Uncharacterized protein n=1 Tax=Mesorhizobium huakuii TaxID=28104 RepID=A0A7G6T1F5_9HYPH|nr:hypothetical protein [Mesorhizobium huakuii]QND60587.1 hypothetical protein HB778_31745 [Mesorhizobium huakuii]